jgi:hypothetical protein
VARYIKKRFAVFGGGPNEVRRLWGIHISTVFPQAATVTNQAAVFIEYISEPGIRVRFIPGAIPLVPAGRYVAIPSALRIVVEILAYQHRPVARIVEPGSNRRFLETQRTELLKASQGQPVPDYLSVVGVLAAQDGNPGRATKRDVD